MLGASGWWLRRRVVEAQGDGGAAPPAIDRPAGRPAAVLLLVGAALAGCAGSRTLPANRPPTADLKGRTPVRVGEPVTFDASGSKDPDQAAGGYIALYRFVFPDGSGEVASATPIVTHVFARSGELDVGLIVTDDRGGEGRTSLRVSVSAEPVPPCAADADCPAGEICVAGECRARPCGPDRPCAPPLLCQMGACVPPTPPPGCRTDSDCTAPRVCDATGACVCKKGLSDCGGQCVDTLSSSGHCGACFRPCAPGTPCAGGTCAGMPMCVRDSDCPAGKSCLGGSCACKPGLTDCLGQCADTAFDRRNCGACGRACATFEMCSFGTCTGMPPMCTFDSDCFGGKTCVGGVCQCKPGTVDCFGTCTDPRFDPRNCGACGLDCGPGGRCDFGMCVGMPMCRSDVDCKGGQVCRGGVCTCGGGLTDCFGLCTSTSTDPANCGKCGNACPPSYTCSNGTCTFSGKCMTDNDCPSLQVCAGGGCVCRMPFVSCGASCVDPQTDARNCGACGRTCAPGQYCGFGSCGSPPRCMTSRDCDPQRYCAGGQCLCSFGLTDCFGRFCADLGSDPTNCGACGNVCSDTMQCLAGRCYRNPRGTVLEIHDLPVPGDPLLGLDSEGFDSFWGCLLSGTTIRFDLFGGVRTKVRNPDPTGRRAPHGVSWSGFRLFAGMYVPPAMGGITSSDLVRYSASGILEKDSIGQGGGTAFGPAGTLFVLTQPTHELVVMNHISFTELSRIRVSGLSSADNVVDIAHDGGSIWVVGMTFGMPSVPFIKIVDPTTGVVTETVPSPDPGLLTAVAYDGGTIWVGGTYLYRLQP